LVEQSFLWVVTGTQHIHYNTLQSKPAKLILLIPLLIESMS